MKEVTEEYQVVRSARRKTAAIQVGESGVVVRVPLWVSDDWISDWVKQKESWINHHRLTLSQNLKQFCLKTEQGHKFPFMGKEYILDWIEGDRWGIDLAHGKLAVNMGKRRGTSKPDALRVEEYLKKWFKQQAELYITERVEYWAEIKGVKYNSLKYKSFKRRWGSCSARGDLVFNWRLIFADIGIIDYVVIHELSHLVHLNHSKKFWTLVEKSCPDWKEKRSDLQKKNGWVLW